MNPSLSTLNKVRDQANQTDGRVDILEVDLHDIDSKVDENNLILHESLIALNIVR